MTTSPSRSSTYLMALEARLDDGYARIDHAVASGIDVTAWESFWLDLLDQYVTAVDVLDALDALDDLDGIDATTSAASELPDVGAGTGIAA